MRVSGIIFILLLIHSSSQFTFEEYENALLSAGVQSPCAKEYLSMSNIHRLTLFDSTAKIPDGLLQGHLHNLGAYDECIGISVPEKNILGKYCTASASPLQLASIYKSTSLTAVNYAEVLRNLSSWKNNNHVIPGISPHRQLKMNIDSSLTYNFGVCIPHHCKADEGLSQVLGIEMDEDHCATKETNSVMTTDAKLALYILLAFLGVAIISTIYDVVITHNDKEPAHDILVAFSMYSNGKKLCKTSNNPNQLLCLNGLKTMNMVWVVVGHYYGFTTSGPMDNTLDYIPWLKTYSNMIVAGATVSVDSFFTISGILSVYTLLRSKDPGLKSNIKGIPMLYVHRYLRLTPAFAIMIYIYWSGLLNYLADGPTWYKIDNMRAECRESWWRALLYIQNYSNSVVCVTQSWYLSVDMQLFIFSPLIWIPIRQWPKRTLQAMFVLAFLGMAIPFGVAFYYYLPASLAGVDVENNFVSKYYFTAHARFGPYVIGMIAGYFIYHAKQRGKTRISPPALFWLWAIVIGGLYASIYAGFPLIDSQAPTLDKTHQPVIDETARWWDAIYLGTCRQVWSMATSLLIYLCVTGNGGPIDWFLSTPFMQFMAKLSYCLYLNHVLFLRLRQNQMRAVYHFGNFEMINQIISLTVISIPISIAHTLLFESPMIIIEKIIFGKNKPKAQKKKVEALA